MATWPPLSPAPEGSLTHGASSKRRHWPEGYRVGRSGRSVKKGGTAVAGGGIERPHQQPHEDDASRRQSDGGPDAAVESDRRHLEDRGIEEPGPDDPEIAEGRQRDVGHPDDGQPGIAAVDRSVQDEQLAKETSHR